MMWDKSISLLLCSLYLFSGVMASADSRACIDDSDCVDLGYKFACFLYKCYNWQEPGEEHPHCRTDGDCRGDNMQCYRHWNLRMVNKGLCFPSHSLLQCQGHSSCLEGEKCCGSHCCPLDYFAQWRNFTCLSDLQCTTLHTGDACCEGNRCCWRDEEENMEDFKQVVVEEKVEKKKEEKEQPLEDIAQPHQEEEEEVVEPVLITDVELEENKFLEETYVDVSEYEEDFSESTTIDISEYATTDADVASEEELFAAMNNATELLMHDDERNNENDKSHDYVYNSDSDTDLVATDTSDNINIIFPTIDDNSLETDANEITTEGDLEAAKESSEKSTNNIVPSIDESPIVHLWNVSYKEPFQTWNKSLEKSLETTETTPSEKSSKEESEEASIDLPPILHLWNVSHNTNEWDQPKKVPSTPVESNEINSVNNYIDKNITTIEEIFVIGSDELDKYEGKSQEKEVSLTMSRLPPRTLQTSAPSIDTDRGETTDSTVPKEILKEAGRNLKELVKLNVGGEMFETFRGTLGKVTNTILDEAIYDEMTGVHHVDACPNAFQVILGWIRYGKGFNHENIPVEYLENVAKRLGIDVSLGIDVLHV